MVMKFGKPGCLRVVFLMLASLMMSACVTTEDQAQQAGVKIDLLIRGICCLRPGVKGISDNIRVISVVGRFLEHSRMYYFHNKGKSDLYVGSADLMPRNIDRRVEVLFPIEDKDLKQYILENILDVYFRDTEKGHLLQSDGRYIPRSTLLQEGEEPFNSQTWFIEAARN